MSNSEKYICIHGHFYQPPRENAWLEFVEIQDSARPYHDWNERITAECYGPNTSSRILDEDSKIVSIVNNYSNISFNIGPTLLSWMEKNSPNVYNSILEADKKSIQNFSGHGSAMAQVYNHLIMPLANRRDKETQVKWGIRDFEHRFKRKPKGMWLAETAVDTETLEVLVENEIQYCLLAPRQAKAFRAIGKKTWTSTKQGINPRHPYICNLPSGNQIVLFFYDAGVSQAVAFEKLLDDGKRFTARLVTAFDNKDKNPQLVHICTDGESYGHHHRFGDMALAYALEYIEENNLGDLTNYSEFLEKFPPQHEVQIHENSSWSCIHGIERWRSACGCNGGRGKNWQQNWRKPLRAALDWLRDEVSDIFEKEMKPYTKNMWAMRDDYIEVVLDRSKERVQELLDKYIEKDLTKEGQTKIVRLLEATRHAMLMYTSCGWFFDEVSDMETTQILQYANRAIQEAEKESNRALEPTFLEMLEKAPSNHDYLKTAKEAYIRYVQPKRLTLSKVGMHYAVCSLFEKFPETLPVYTYVVTRRKFDREVSGKNRLSVGLAEVHSTLTYSKKCYTFAVMYLGQNHIIGNFSDEMSEEKYEKMSTEMTDAFSKSSLAEVIGKMQHYFGERKFTLNSLFREDRKKILDMIVERELEQAENAFVEIYNDNYNLMNVLLQDELPIPDLLKKNLEAVINNRIIHFFQNGSTHKPKRLEELVEEAHKWKVELNKSAIQFVASEKMYQMMKVVEDNLSNNEHLHNIKRILYQLTLLDIEPDFWRVQNCYFKLGQEHLSDKEFAAEVGNEEDIEWLNTFNEIGVYINVKLD